MTIQIKHCNCCGSSTIEVSGKKYLCRSCNIVYEVTDTGTTVLNTDPLSKHEQRLDVVERDLAALKKQQGGDDELDDKPTSEPEGEVDELDKDEPEDGFLRWE